MPRVNKTKRAFDWMVTTVAHNCHGKRINLPAKRITSRQKEKPHGKKKKTHGKKKNLTAKRKTSRQKEKDSRQKEKPHGKKKNLTARRKRLTAKRKPYDKRKRLTVKFLPCRENILILISFVVRSRLLFLP